MQIRQLDTSRPKDIKQFIQFPFELYMGSALWVPPLIRDQQRMLDREGYPFYKHSTAAFFVVETGQETLGRIAAIHNRRYTGHSGRKAAFFYFFDCVDDRAVSRALFGAAFQWARDQELELVIGPKGLLRADGMGLLVEGFQWRPAMGIPYNYPYYEELVEDAGFVKEVDYLSGHMQRGQDLPPRFYDVAERVRQRRGFEIVQFDSKQEVRRMIPAIGKIYNEAFTEVWGYYPIDDDELNLIAQRLLSIADPKLIKLVMKEEEIAGFVFSFPDVGTALRRSRGRLWPLGWWHLMREFKRTDWLSINRVGLLPKYQGVGGSAVLYAELAKTIHQTHFVHGDFAQVAETNQKSMSDVSAMGVDWYKRHRIYRREL